MLGKNKQKCDKISCLRQVHYHDKFNIGCNGQCNHCNRHCIHYHIFEAINYDKEKRMLPNFEENNKDKVYRALYNGSYHRHNMVKLQNKREEYENQYKNLRLTNVNYTLNHAKCKNDFSRIYKICNDFGQIR
jgi:hypothetical protein